MGSAEREARAEAGRRFLEEIGHLGYEGDHAGFAEKVGMTTDEFERIMSGEKAASKEEFRSLILFLTDMRRPELAAQRYQGLMVSEAHK